MPKLVDNMVVRFTGVFELDGTPFSSWRDAYLGFEGLLCIFESENKAPGKKFVYFFPNEPEALNQRYLHTSPGDMTIDGDKIILDSKHRYEFETGDFLDETDLRVLKFNVSMYI